MKLKKHFIKQINKEQKLIVLYFDFFKFQFFSKKKLFQKKTLKLIFN